ncbi:hypothetical protein [Herbiconiux sp.]|uniref:hypothetical protein n=1 Tax=Herbiconiux sp. TaxID=1871186 RepID=UPI0025C20EC3|nr:hypothetical protein [Herbiconiux sp.]
MAALLIVLIVVGVLLVLGGLFLKPLWRVAVRPFYRQPDAQEPSKLGWGVRSGGMVLAGAVVIVASATLLSQTAPAQPSASAIARETCATLVDQVGSPSGLTAAEKAVTDAADAAGYEVKREDTSSDSVAELPSGDTTITVDVTTWTVVDGSDTVATFTWTTSGSVPGRFTGSCSKTP